jgi:hypothetical protein
MSKKKTHPKIDGQYAPHIDELIMSPSWRALSLSARRLLDRIEHEHNRHGGQENGLLPVTFDQFAEYGIHRHAIAPAMRECVALGLLKITRKGRAGPADTRLPNLFLLTYLAGMGKHKPTHDWRNIKTIEEAEAIAAVARVKPPNPRQQPAKRGTRKNQISGDGF